MLKKRLINLEQIRRCGIGIKIEKQINGTDPHIIEQLHFDKSLTNWRQANLLKR